MTDKLVKPAPQLPANYHPATGLQEIVQAESLERQFKRAKDATRLLKAVEHKLGEQRKFVLWWDLQDKQQGRPKRSGSGTLIAGRDGMPERKELFRWRARLFSEVEFQTTLAKAQARCIKVCETGKGQNDYARLTNTGEVEWYTPPEYLDLARQVLGQFDLDPASSETAQRTVRASEYFTRADTPLEQEWRGRVWLNPPYQQPAIEHFVSKLVTSYQAGSVTAAILLTNNSTDTTWFHLAAHACAAICFPRGRITFLMEQGEAGSPLQGQAFFYFGPHVAAFAHRFATTGFVVAPV